MTRLNSPLTFEPIFQERIWGGRKLEELFGKKLPAGKRIGESWEIVDRLEAQSVVRNGPLRGKTLHQLWMEHRQAIFGDIPDVSRFPLLIKLLDAREKLSLQVHPPEQIAIKLRGEPKTEFWYVAAAEPGAELLVGFRHQLSREQLEDALHQGSLADHVNNVPVREGDAIFLPAGRFHAVGAGNLLVEIQQNSDTTYRLFDWNRRDENGKPRTLHIEQAVASIDLDDLEPQLIEPKGELLVRHELFEIQKWNLNASRELVPPGKFSIVCCLTGKLRCGKINFLPGEFFLLPAQIENRKVEPMSREASLLRVTIPK
jgi:mannose-6-phosphate isomerase